MAIAYPPVFINNYLAEKLNSNFGAAYTLPFLPTMPTDIDGLTEAFPDSNNAFAVFDRMFRMRRSPFPHIKCEQLLYYFYKMAGDPTYLIELTQKVQDLLDRGDESAQEINEWIRNLPRDPDGTVYFGRTFYSDGSVNQPGTNFLPVFFHSMKIYQLEETRDIIDFGTARTYAGNKMIVDYDWHSVGEKDGLFNGTAL